MKSQIIPWLLTCLNMLSIAKGTTVSFNANYDNLPANTVGGTNGVGTYDDLTYNSFIVASGALTLVGDVVTHTLPNNIITVAQLQMMNGTPSVTVAAPFKTFSFFDFWFGCNLNSSQGAAGVAVQCVVTVAGFVKSSDREVALASFTFTPPPNPIAKVPMIHAVLPPSFHNLYNVTIVQNSPLTQALALDNLNYAVSK